jgi:hypothetical protein
VKFFNKSVGLDSLFTIKIGQAMTDKIRKTSEEFTPDQRFEYFCDFIPSKNLGEGKLRLRYWWQTG